jgi:hypothetical protein
MSFQETGGRVDFLKVHSEMARVSGQAHVWEIVV